MEEKSTVLVCGTDVLHPIAEGGEVALESVLGNDDGAATVVGMEGERGGVAKAAVEEKDDVVVGIVDETEGADATGFEPEVTHHSFGRGKGEFARCTLTLRDQDILEPMLDVVDGEVVVAGEADEIVLVALVIAHENVLAMHAAVVVPPAFCLLDGFALGVVVGSEGDIVLLQVAEHFLLTRRYDFAVGHANGGR